MEKTWANNKFISSRLINRPFFNALTIILVVFLLFALPYSISVNFGLNWNDNLVYNFIFICFAILLIIIYYIQTKIFRSKSPNHQTIAYKSTANKKVNLFFILLTNSLRILKYVILLNTFPLNMIIQPFSWHKFSTSTLDTIIGNMFLQIFSLQFHLTLRTRTH